MLSKFQQQYEYIRLEESGFLCIRDYDTGMVTFGLNGWHKEYVPELVTHRAIVNDYMTFAVEQFEKLGD